MDRTKYHPERPKHNPSEYRASASEERRTDDLLSLLPEHGSSILDIGARDGHFSRLLSDRFSHVIALDLNKPQIECPGVETIVGDVTRLPLCDASAPWVFCTEVLEHVRDLEAAASEITRVTREFLLVGVPDRQDIRVGQTTCQSCGNTGTPWGHINVFDEPRLRNLFSAFEIVTIRHAGWTRERTNPISTILNNFSGNPFGTYDQEEPCVHCSALLVEPPTRTLFQRLATRTAHSLEHLQNIGYAGHPNWINILFRRRS